MTPRRWTADDTATLRRMASAGYSDAEIARHLGRPRESICRQRQAAGIPSMVNRVWLAAMARASKRRHGLAQAA